MKNLALLGLQNDGKHLTLNDAEGNRYSLAITDDLRALMRHDVTHKNTKDSHARSVTPREIQAYVRAGKTVAEISELTATPPSHIETLAHPIINERTYMARRARSLPTTRDPGALTLEELVATRLASRGVKSEDIVWDAIRENGEPWTIIARYESAERERTAIWHVDLAKRSLEAVSEEAVWLSETPLLPHSDVWRAPNTPPLREENSSSSISSLPSAPSTPSAPSVPSPEQTSHAEPVPVSRIDAVLADLDARRGIPTDNEHYTSLIESESETIESSGTTDTADTREDAQKNARETIFDLPAHLDDADLAPRDTPDRENKTLPASSDTANDNSRTNDLFSSATTETVTPADSISSTESEDSTQSQKKIRRSDRPSMPTWDEIVFGKKD